MKRRISLVLALLMIFMVWTPVQGLAQNDKGLEQAIRAVKAKIQIPENFSKFSYNGITEGDRTVWYLDWNGEDFLSGSINARVDTEGTILSYNFYKPYDYDGVRGFPKVSRQEARKIAEAFIEKMEPGLLAYLDPADGDGPLEIGRVHSFSYVRLENGIPYYGNGVNIDVNSEFGEVCNYYYNWSGGLSFPKPEGIISLEDAKDAYKDHLGLKLIYSYNYEKEESRVYAVYVPIFDSGYGIDAQSGERIRISPYYDIYPLMGARNAMKEEAAMDAGGLTPEEQKAVEQVSGMVSKEKAEQIARGVKELEISRDYKVTMAYLQKDWGIKDSYTWELSFENKEDKEKDVFDVLWVRVNAKDGSLKGYSRYIPIDGQKEGKYTVDEAKVAAETFLKAVCGDRFKNMEFDEGYGGHDYTLKRDKNPLSYSFRYVRKVNGIQFPNNSTYVSFDAVNGKITSFNMDWYDLEFPSVENALEMENIYGTMFEKIGLDLMYSDMYKEDQQEKGGDKRQEIKLIYNLKKDKPVIFDAFSGVILDGSGKPYVEQEVAIYKDIEGHFAQNHIMALAEYGISLPGTEFKPDDNILQKDYLRLLVKAMGYYGTFDDEYALDDMYNVLIREKVITKDEKNPDASVTKETAAKFLIKALKFQNVADLEGIFVTDFKDEASISPELVGYVAIAKGLGVIDGSDDGYFYPNNGLTRAETAVMLYNYLKGL